KNWVSGNEAAEDLGEGADDGTDDTLKVEGLHNSFAAVHESVTVPHPRALTAGVGWPFQLEKDRRSLCRPTDCARSSGMWCKRGRGAWNSCCSARSEVTRP